MKTHKPENQRPLRAMEHNPENPKPLRIIEQNQQVRIRPMEPADAPRMAQIERQSFTDPWSAGAFLESMALPYTCFLVAEVSEKAAPQQAESEVEKPPETEKTAGSPAKWKLAGFCGSYISCDEAEIVNVTVEKAERRKGIGRQMLSELLENNAGRGVTAFMLEVRVSNTPAISLYQSLGFQIEGTRRRFYENPVEDAYVMGKRLSEAGSNSH